MRRLSADQVTELHKRAAAGQTAKAIALDMNIAVATAEYRLTVWRRQHGIVKPRGHPLSRSTRDAIVKAGREGSSCADVAAALGLGLSTVYRHFSEAGIPTRTRGGRRNPDLALRIAERVRAGDTWDHIASEAGVHTRTVAKYVARHRLLNGTHSLPVKGELGSRCRARMVAARRREALFINSQAGAARRDALYAQIAERVPRWIDPATRDDIISDAYLAAIQESI